MDFTNLFNLKGKVALVTGGSQGLGSYIVQGLLQYGVRVGVFDIKKPEHKSWINDFEKDYSFIQCDVSDPIQVSKAVQKIVKNFKRIDILVNCAGIVEQAMAENMSNEIWDSVIKVNLYGTFYVCREVGKIMIMQKSGKIVNMASQAGVIGLPRGNSNYCTSKGGVIALTKTLAVEWAKYNIRVNSVSPCHFNTPFTEKLMKDPNTSNGILARIPLGRIGEANDIVGPVIFLVSNASSMITGHNLMVDGGVTSSY